VNTLSSHLLDEIRELPAKYPQPRSAVMPALDLAQEELGHLTPEAMTEVAEALQLDPGYVEGVATFYTLFHLQPIGKHHFYVCTNLSCSLRGSDEIVDQIKKTVGVREPDEVSKDGLFSYEEVECLGACEKAPMMRFEHGYHYFLTPEKIDALILERRSPSPLSPTTGAASGQEESGSAFSAASPERGEGDATSRTASPGRGEGEPKPKKTRKKTNG
jgi:NADH-quinone oxidoreductase subunit E